MSAPTLNAPSSAPVYKDSEAGGPFSIAGLIGGYRGRPTQQAVTEAVQKRGSDLSQMVEGMIGGFAERVDNLMNDISYAEEAPALFSQSWILTAYNAALGNEAWFDFWIEQGKPR